MLFVETDGEDQKKLKKVVKQHPKLERAGTEVTHTRLLMFFFGIGRSSGIWALVFQGRPKHNNNNNAAATYSHLVRE